MKYGGEPCQVCGEYTALTFSSEIVEGPYCCEEHFEIAEGRAVQ